MLDSYMQILSSLRRLMVGILEPKLDLDEFLSRVALAAKELSPDQLEARVWEVDFIENRLFLRACTGNDISTLDPDTKDLTIRPKTITGDAVIENRVIVASKAEGYAESRFFDGEYARAAFPIEFSEEDGSEGRTKYVLVVDKKAGSGPLSEANISALKDYSVLAGIIISIKELRDSLSRFYEENRNLVLTGRHSAAIAHDIRSLNVGVGGFLNQTLRRMSEHKREAGLKAEIRSISLAKENSAQIEALLKDFSLFNQPNTILERDTDLYQAIYDKLASLKTRTEYGRLVRFELDIEDRDTGFLVDPNWFSTVVENLVKNSIDACKKNCVIKVGLKTTDHKHILTFEDNCKGIPLDMLPHIFTPFKSSKKYGQGLGLANARKVIEDHGGTISAANTKNGSGAIFTVEFDR